MNSDRLNKWVQTATGLAIVVGLGLVIWELQQSREATSSQLSSDHYQIVGQHYAALFGENPADVLAKACDSAETLTRSELFVLDSYYSDVLQKIGRMHTLSLRGRFYSNDYWQDRLDWLDILFMSEAGRAYWHTVAYVHPDIRAAGEQYLASWDRPFCSEFYDIWMNEILKSKEVGKHKQPS